MYGKNITKCRFLKHIYVKIAQRIWPYHLRQWKFFRFRGVRNKNIKAIMEDI